jgi:hypothetical protein
MQDFAQEVPSLTGLLHVIAADSALYALGKRIAPLLDFLRRVDAPAKIDAPAEGPVSFN